MPSYLRMAGGNTLPLWKSGNGPNAQPPLKLWKITCQMQINPFGVTSQNSERMPAHGLSLPGGTTHARRGTMLQPWLYRNFLKRAGTQGSSSSPFQEMKAYRGSASCNG